MEAPNRDDKYAHSEDLKVNFEELIAAGNSLKTIGQIMELIGAANLFSINERPTLGDKQALSGIVLQTIGQIIQTTGIFQQLGEPNDEVMLQGQKNEIVGTSLKTAGYGLETAGEINLFNEEQESTPPSLNFIP
ncbi:hypothetical protein [Priestia megaterium]|uniref:hypothetical protein n=1 Tax=Priestia megaterium TaxID=1404 RepID=UPI00188546CB|nr:hypothetical protein [Priestia megaterium]